MAHAYFTKTMSSGSDHKPGKWEGTKVFCAASILWSCCSAVESAESKVMQLYHLTTCNLGLWERGWQHRPDPASWHPHTKAMPWGASAANFSLLPAMGAAQKGWSRIPETGQELTLTNRWHSCLITQHCYHSETTSAGRSSSCSERNTFVLGGMEWKNALHRKGSKKPAIKLVL